MDKKFLIIASKKDKAGISITTQLSTLGKFDFYLVEENMLQTENLDLMKIQDYDFVIFASKHSSEKKDKTLSIHSPGNWVEARGGGADNNVCMSSALFNKQLFVNLNEIAKEHDLDEKYKVTLECTHHGPFIQKPCVFIEVGATDLEWSDRRASFVIAKTIKKTIEEFKENPYNEITVGIGGPHYCPSFNKLQLESNVAISHIIPNYIKPLTEENILEAIRKTDEEVDFVILDWKGLGKAEERDAVVEILNKNHIDYKRSSQIKR